MRTLNPSQNFSLKLILACLFLIPPIWAAEDAAPAQSSQSSAEKRNFDYYEKQYAKAKNDRERANALVGKAESQTNMGLADDAMSTLAQAQALAPDSLKVRLQHAITLDRLGKHDEAFTELSELRELAGNHADQLKAYERKPSILGIKLTKAQAAVEIALQVQGPSAHNFVFIKHYGEALDMFKYIDHTLAYFKSIEDMGRENKDSDLQYRYMIAEHALKRSSNFYGQWILWLTACLNQDDPEKSKNELAKIIESHDGEYFSELISRFYNGELTAQAVLEGLEKNKKPRTIGKTTLPGLSHQEEAAFFCAGYLRFVAGDIAGAVKLLEDADARSTSTTLMRQFIREQLADKSWQSLANSKPYTPSVGPALLHEDASQRGRIASTLKVPEDLTLADVRKAVNAALTAKKWRITSDIDSKATAEYGRAKGPLAPGTAIITVTYDERTISIYNAGSPSPGWVGFLKTELDTQLSRQKAAKR